MQCASSTAKSAIRVRASWARKRSLLNRSGATYSSFSEPARSRSKIARCSAASRLESSRAASIPLPLQEVDLILHQRDQRRDDDRHPVEQQRRQLVAEALAAAGREDGERRPPGEERLDDLLLARAGSASKPNLAASTSSADPRRRREVGHPGRLIGLSP